MPKGKIDQGYLEIITIEGYQSHRVGVYSDLIAKIKFIMHICEFADTHKCCTIREYCSCISKDAELSVYRKLIGKVDVIAPMVILFLIRITVRLKKYK